MLTFEMCKNLEQLGFPQDKSLWIWIDSKGNHKPWKVVRGHEKILSSPIEVVCACPILEDLLPFVNEKLRAKWGDTYDVILYPSTFQDGWMAKGSSDLGNTHAWSTHFGEDSSPTVAVYNLIKDLADNE